MRKLIRKCLNGWDFNVPEISNPYSLPNTKNVGGNALGIDWTSNDANTLRAKDIIAGKVTDSPDMWKGSTSLKSLLDKIKGGIQGVWNNPGILLMGSSALTSLLPLRKTSKGVDIANNVLSFAENIPVYGKFATLAKLGLNALDSLGGSKLATLNNNLDIQDTLARTGGGYGDFMSDWNDASELSGLRVGLFFGKSSANNQIYDANRLMSILSGIMGNLKDNESILANQSWLLNEKTMMGMNGGPGNITFGLKGLKITRKNIATAKRVVSTVKRKRPTFKEWYKTVPSNKNDTIDYDLETAYNELSKTPTGWAALEKFRKDPEAHLDGRYKKPSHATYDENLDEEYRGKYGWFGSDEIGWQFHPSPRLLLLRSTPEKNGIQWYKEYWDLYEPESTLVIGEYGKDPVWSYTRNPMKLSEFDINPSNIEIPNSLYVKKPILFEKEGGKMNVIPEGSLHARLHHMENADGLTKKGIPVVSIAEGGELEQLAEIELNEIIFRLEVTQELEKLMEDGSDNAAIEAGKLLVKEIFENTDDRTGLIKLLEPEKKESTTEDIVKNHQVF